MEPILCPCGCKEEVTENYAYTIYDNEPFIDNFHVIEFLKNANLLEEVG